MLSPIITGLMAYGMSGRIFHAPFLEAHPGFKLKAVTERNQKTAREYYPDIISYNTADELLADDEISLVIVNTPNHTHFDLAARAIKAGKHVLIEKPVAHTRLQAKQLFDLGREYNCQVMIYQNRRWDSDFLSVKQVVESGQLGKLIEVSFRFDRYKPALSPKAFKEVAALGANGLVYDLGPHLLDQLISLFGAPLSFTKTKAVNRPGSQVDDYFFIQLSYPDKLNVMAASSLLTAQGIPAFVLHGTRGTYIKNRTDVQEVQLDQNMQPTDIHYGLEAPGAEGQLTLIDAEGNKSVTSVPSLKGDYTDLFEAVFQSIRHGAAYPVTEENILCQMELLEA